MDLEITTHIIMTDYLNSDEFLKVVEDKVKKSINDSIESALNWNSKTKKAIDEKISKIKSILNLNVLAEGVVVRSSSVPIRMNDSDRLEGIRGFSNNRFSFKIINPEWLLKYDN